MLDLPVRGRPLVRIVVAEVHRVRVHAPAIDEHPRDAAAAHLRVVGDVHAVAHGLAAREARPGERLVFSVQPRVREVADVVHDHRVVRAPREVHRHARPPIRALQLRDVGNPPLARPRRVAGEDPHQAVARLHRIRAHADVRQRMAEEVVRHARQPPVGIVAPAMIRARQPAVFDRAQRELELAMAAAVLERMQRAALIAVERDRRPPEGDLDHAAARHACLVLDCVPVVGMEPGRAGLVAARARVLVDRRHRRGAHAGCPTPTARTATATRRRRR